MFNKNIEIGFQSAVFHVRQRALRLVSIADPKLRNGLASAMRIDMETWLGLTVRSWGRVCDIRSQVPHVLLLRTLMKFAGLLQGMETQNAG